MRIPMSTRLSSLQSEPKYLKLADHLREQVHSGRLQPGDRLPSFPELKAQGIGQNTVERALGVLERENLIERRNGRGIFVAEYSATAQTTSKGVIGFCGLGQMLSSASPYWNQVIAGVHDILKTRSMQLMLLDVHVSDIHDKVDGVLIDPAWAHPQEKWRREKWPCVSMVAPSGLVEVSSAVVDDYAGQRQATQHLLDLGHRRIAYLHASVMGGPTQHRIAGYREALQAAGIKTEHDWLRALDAMPVIDFRQTGRESMTAWLEDHWKETACTALMAHNDEAAIGAMEAFEAAGYDVPRDVSIMGFDGTSLCEYSRPRLTSVEVPLREIGQSATEMLLQQIEDGVGEIEHVTLPTRIVVRDSTAPPKKAPHK